MTDPREPGWGLNPPDQWGSDLASAGQETTHRPDVPPAVERRSHAIQEAQDTVRRIQQAAAKGQVALLVTDAAGVVIVGIKGTGGMTRLAYNSPEGIWEAHVYLSGVTVLDGSYMLRDVDLPDPPPPTAPWLRTPGGWDDPDAGDVISDEQAEAFANRVLERHRQLYEPPRLEGPHPRNR